MQQPFLQNSANAQVWANGAPMSYSVEPEGLLYYAPKRLLDIVLILLVALPLLPFLLLIALAIRLDTHGPVFFVQNRVGARRVKRNGQTVWEVSPFCMYKFRTMYHNADQSIHEAHIKAWVQGELEASDETAYKIEHDPRVTRVGHLLRATSLDEIPQLLNVLKGEMSLVGPRPVPIYEVAGYQPQHYERLAATPGITGLWQVKGRGRVTFEEMVELDVEYVRSRSLWLDLKILLWTVFAVFSGAGAV